MAKKEPLKSGSKGKTGRKSDQIAKLEKLSESGKLRM
jgi:hypothetical protein